MYSYADLDIAALSGLRSEDADLNSNRHANNRRPMVRMDTEGDAGDVLL